MKKVVLFLLIGVLALSLCACGDVKEKTEEVKEEIQETKQEVEEKADEVEKEVEKKVEEEKNLLAELGFVEKDGVKESIHTRRRSRVSRRMPR